MARVTAIDRLKGEMLISPRPRTWWIPYPGPHIPIFLEFPFHCEIGKGEMGRRKDGGILVNIFLISLIFDDRKREVKRSK